MKMNQLVILLLLVVPCVVQSNEEELQALFLGNSLTYVNNLPVVFATLGEANGKTIKTVMLAKAGATLSELASSADINAFLDENSIDLLVMQERGGLLLCPSYSQQFIRMCEESSQTHAILAEAAHSVGAKAVLIGTYQPDGAFGAQLAEGEVRQASEAGIQFVITVADDLAAAVMENPEMKWFLDDDVHPGKDFTMLYAILLYREVFGEWPIAHDLAFPDPSYSVQSKFGDTDFVWQLDEENGVRNSLVYSINEVQSVLDVAKRHFDD